MNHVSDRGRHGRGFRALIAAVLCGLGLALTGAAPAAAAPCLRGHLQLVFHNQNTIGGHRFWDFAYRNSGPHRCTLQGYTYAALLGPHGQPLPQAGAQVHHQMGHAQPQIALEPGNSAFFTFAWSISAPCLFARFHFYRVEFEPPSALFHPGPGVLQPPALSICPGTARVTPFRAHL
jgi:hypothetical protein